MTSESALGFLSRQLTGAGREVFWVVVGQGTMILGAFVGIKALTNAMGPEAYGELGLGMTIAGLLNQFVYGPLNQAVFRFYSVYRERRTLSVYFHAVVRMHVLLAVVVVIFCSASVAAVSTWVSGEWAWLTAAALLFGLISGANGFFLAANTAMRARKIVALHEGADAWLRIACAVGALYFFGNRGFIALMGYLLGTLLVTLSQTVFFSGVGATSHTVAAV